VAVGITAHAQAQLGDVVYVQLPTLGRHYAAGETCAVIESVKAAADVYSPLAGCVLAINSGLSETPELINQDPYTAGWLFELELAADATLDSLLDAAGYAALTASE
jgi:glycine cleavage system H protein